MTGVRTLDRYVLREVVPPFVIALVVFSFIALVDRIERLTDLVIARGAPLGRVVWLLVLMAPSVFTVTLPLALLVATALSCSRLAADGETIAVQAAGIGPLRLLRPLVAGACLVSGVMAIIMLVVNPWTYTAIRHEIVTILKARAEIGIEERVFAAGFDKVVVYAEELHARTRQLRNVLVSDERQPGSPRIFVAQAGQFVDAAADRVTLRLRRGAFGDLDASDPPPSRFVMFEECDLTVATASVDAIMSSMKKRRSELPLVRLFRRSEPADDTDEDERRAAAVEAHKRFALPLVPLVFVLIAYPIGVLAGARHRGVATAGVLGVAVFYYVIFTATENAAMSRGLAPSAVWLADGLFGSVGAVLAWLMCSGRADRWLTATRVSQPRVASLRPRGTATPPGPLRRRTFGAMFTTVDRYLAREFLVRLTAAIGVLATLLLLVEMIQGLDDVRAAGLSASEAARYFGVHLIGGMYEALPIAVLSATIFLFLALSKHHELDALKAAGISLHRLSVPVICVAATVTTAALVFQDTMLPTIKRRTQAIDALVRPADGRSVFDRRSDAWARTGDTHFVRRSAGSATTVGAVRRASLDVEIERTFRVIRRLSSDATALHVAEAMAPARPGHGPVRTRRGERDAGRIVVERGPDTMTVEDLRRYIGSLRAVGRDVRGLLIALYARFAFPFAHVVFTVLVIPLAAARHRHHRVFGIAFIVAVMIAYWLVHATAIAAAKADLLPPLLGAWASNLTFAGIGLAAFVRART